MFKHTLVSSDSWVTTFCLLYKQRTTKGSVPVRSVSESMRAKKNRNNRYVLISPYVFCFVFVLLKNPKSIAALTYFSSFPLYTSLPTRVTTNVCSRKWLSADGTWRAALDLSPGSVWIDHCVRRAGRSLEKGTEPPDDELLHRLPLFYFPLCLSGKRKHVQRE